MVDEVNLLVNKGTYSLNRKIICKGWHDERKVTTWVLSVLILYQSLTSAHFLKFLYLKDGKSN